MEVRAARASERDQVLDLLANWYSDRSFFARYNCNDPAFRDDLCIVADDAGRLVATAQIFDRTINLKDQPVSMGGIGSVFTMESHRGRGIGSALMERAVATLRGEGFELSMLFAERTDFYARFGWRCVSRIFSAITDAATIVVDRPDDFELATFEPARDLVDVATIHRAYSGIRNFTVIRNDADWRANLRFAGNPDEHFVVCRRGKSSDSLSQIDAYARAIWFHGVPMVMEFGYAGDSAIDSALALFRHLGEAAAGLPSSFGRDLTGGRGALILNGGAPTSLLVTHTAHHPAFESRARTAGATIFHHEDSLFMWSLIAPERLAERLSISIDATEERLFAMLAEPTSLYWTADRF